MPQNDAAVGMESYNESILIVGTGNVATHLAKALGPHLCGIVSRTPSHARSLANRVGCSFAGGFADVRGLKPDVIIVSLADHALADTLQAIGRLDYNPLVMHTSGTVPKEALKPVSPRTAVLYPLQSFSASVDVDMKKVPFFTEADCEADLRIVDAIACSISDVVNHADSEHRKLLHVAGVFTNNFTNILLEACQRVLAEGGYSLDVVRPLLEATVSKAFEVGPHAAQTGPARRGDTAVMKAHCELLPDDLRPVYTVLSDLIVKSHSKE